MKHYLGMRPGDLDGKPYAKFWNPRVAPLALHACRAIAHGQVAEPVLAALDEAWRWSRAASLS
jgi:hypothetical protein